MIPGLYQDTSVVGLALSINSVLGNVGNTLMVSQDAVNPLPSNQLAELRELAADLNTDVENARASAQAQATKLRESAEANKNKLSVWWYDLQHTWN